MGNLSINTAAPYCQNLPCKWLSLASAEFLHLSSPVVEWPPHPHKNCSLAAHFPLQPEDSPVNSVPRLLCRSPLNLLSLFTCLSLAPCILYLNLGLLNLYLFWLCSSTRCSCLGMVVWLGPSTLCTGHIFMTLHQFNMNCTLSGVFGCLLCDLDMHFFVCCFGWKCLLNKM